MISKHISDKEGVYSTTATRLSLDNKPSQFELANMKELAEQVFEPLREWVGGPIRINSFYRGKALNKAIKHARDGKGPTFLEMKTYRYRGHSMSDAQHYRTKSEVEEYRKIDPITQVKNIIIENNYLSADELAAIDADIKARVLECEKFAEDSPYPEKSVMYDAVYEEPNYPFLKHKLS